MPEWLDEKKTTQTIDSCNQSQIILSIIKGIIMREWKNNKEQT